MMDISYVYFDFCFEMPPTDPSVTTHTDYPISIPQ